MHKALPLPSGYFVLAAGRHRYLVLRRESASRFRAEAGPFADRISAVRWAYRHVALDQKQSTPDDEKGLGAPIVVGPEETEPKEVGQHGE